MQIALPFGFTSCMKSINTGWHAGQQLLKSEAVIMSARQSGKYDAGMRAGTTQVLGQVPIAPVEEDTGAGPTHAQTEAA
ncbi:unnamed protein product [Ectocarpus sp. CCAP 1310/34]|nr:unnamed protein product [Ectocarpus sp. CCAP 1310/34]